MMELLVPSDRRNLPPSVAALGRGNEAFEVTRVSAARDKSEGSLLDGSSMGFLLGFDGNGQYGQVFDMSPSELLENFDRHVR